MKKMFVYLLLRRIFCLDEKVILDMVPGSSKRMLDLGCGYGYIAYLLARDFPDARIVGVDTDESRIMQAQQTFKLKNLEFITEDASKLDFKDKFDAILAIDLFHHIPAKLHGKILEKISEHLADGGKLIIRDIEKTSDFSVFNTIHDFVLNRCYVNFKSFSEWEDLLNKFGFTVEKKFFQPKFVYPYLYIVSFKKMKLSTGYL